jgi:hypothetical protein
MVQIHSPRPLFLINDLYHTQVTRKYEERLVRNQAFLSHARWTQALLVL